MAVRQRRSLGRRRSSQAVGAITCAPAQFPPSSTTPLSFTPRRRRGCCPPSLARAPRLSTSITPPPPTPTSPLKAAANQLYSQLGSPPARSARRSCQPRYAAPVGSRCPGGTWLVEGGCWGWVVGGALPYRYPPARGGGVGKTMRLYRVEDEELSGEPNRYGPSGCLNLDEVSGLVTYLYGL